MNNVISQVHIKCPTFPKFVRKPVCTYQYSVHIFDLFCTRIWLILYTYLTYCVRFAPATTTSVRRLWPTTRRWWVKCTSATRTALPSSCGPSPTSRHPANLPRKTTSGMAMVLFKPLSRDFSACFALNKKLFMKVFNVFTLSTKKS